MSDSEILSILKMSLQNPPGVLDDYLLTLMQGAEAEIAEKGISLDKSSIEDVNLIVMYASWRYLKRNGDKGMPRSLRYALHSRLISEKGKVNAE